MRRKAAVEMVNNMFPSLPVSQGNVLDLYYESGSISAYISMGVVEHFEEEPEESLAEAFRVLEPVGVEIISVPMNNSLWSRCAVESVNELPAGSRF